MKQKETERRSLAERIFGRLKKKPTPQEPSGYAKAKLLNSWQTIFTPFGGSTYDQAQVRAAVHTFAKRAACVKIRHVCTEAHSGEACEDVKGSNIARIFEGQANQIPTTGYKLLYRLATQYKLYNNAFLYPVYEYNEITRREKLVEIYNINASTTEIVEYEGEFFCIFTFTTSGNRYVVPYADVIHITADVNENDIFGESNASIRTTLKLAHSLKQNLEKYAELIQIVRGILVINNGSVKDSDLREIRKKFIRENLTEDEDDNSGGLIVHDGKMTYKPLETKETPIPRTQLDFVKDEIYEYFGVSSAIVNNTATTAQETAFYNGELVPFYTQLQQALTARLCRDKKTKIVCTSSRLAFAALSEKHQIITFFATIGGITLDEARELMGLPPFGGEEGKRRLQSLNYASANVVDEYQTGKKDKPSGGGDKPQGGKKEKEDEPQTEETGGGEEGEGDAV